MPPLEEQIPPVNPLVVQRPDALDPPDREEEETSRAENRAEDETPIPGSLADGIDRVTLSANAQRIAPVEPTEQTVPSPLGNGANPELVLDVDTSAGDEVLGAGLQDFVRGVEENRVPNEETILRDRNPAEPLTTPVLVPATPFVPTAEPATREEVPSRIENRIAPEPAANIGRNENPGTRNENRFAPLALGPRDQFATPETTALSESETIPIEPEEELPLENPLGLRGNNPVPLDRSVNIIPPANTGEDAPGPNIQEARNFGQGRTLSLDLATAGNDSNVIAPNTVDDALEEAGVTPAPDTINEEAPFELLIAPAVRSGFVSEPEPIDESEAVPDLTRDDTPAPALTELADTPGPEGINTAVASLLNTQQVLEDTREFQDLQPPAFPELDPDEPFIANVEPAARAEVPPVVAQQPLNAPLPEFENVVPVAPPVPGNVVALDENPQALRRDNLGTDPALRGNREIRNFLQQFNDRIEVPEAVTDPTGGPITEVQNNAPPPPAVFENLEALSAELLEQVREQGTREGVTRPEEERTAPPEPRTPEQLLTERGQNIDRFI